MGGMVPASVSPGCDCSLGKETPGGGGGMGEEGAPSSPPPPTGVFHQHTDQPFRCCKLVIPENPLAGQGGGTPVSCVAPPPPAGGRDRPSPRLPPGLGALVKLGGGGSSVCVAVPFPCGDRASPPALVLPPSCLQGGARPRPPPSLGGAGDQSGTGTGTGTGGGEGGCAPAQGGRAHACPRPALSRSPRSDWSGANLYANLPAGGEGRGLETEVGGV